MNNLDIIMYESFQEEQKKRKSENEGRSLLYPNADDEEYEEELMDQCFKED
jgi:hypothetical protein